MEENKILSKLNSILLSKKKNLFKFPKKNSPVILCFSGGLDSTCLWFLLAKKYRLKVYPILFYQSKLSYLINKIRFSPIEFFFKKKFPSLYKPIIYYKISFPYIFSSSKTKQLKTDLNLSLPNLKIINLRKIFGKDFPNIKKVISVISGVPARTMYFSILSYFWLIRLKYQYEEKINTIFFGTVKEDTILRDQTLTQLRAVNLSLSLSLGDFNLQVIAPIDKQSNFFYYKKELVEFAFKNNFPFIFKTFSCLKSQIYHCGACYNCFTRRKVFLDLKIEDKTFYFNNFKKLLFFSKFKLKIFSFFTKVLKKISR